ncbi:hypothetical protein JCM19241_5591 [Vibrio ishigakensis]|uniref:Uncharacterized protein n=1 Tax=Vibrio ishigakensis TaxID=1481914 RepID=A0A0B8Q496_9VIBR|nr:hypothetical protein JCM19241_5591 [Vibrio ishigakensis]
MNMLKLVPIALLSIGLTACGGESGTPEQVIKEVKVPAELKDNDWALIASSSEQKLEGTPELLVHRFDPEKPFTVDNTTGLDIQKTFAYKWRNVAYNTSKDGYEPQVTRKLLKLVFQICSMQMSTLKTY